MLEETKQMYEDQASSIPNWRELSKTELCNLYVENEGNSHLRDSYFSAIILKYWNKIYSLHSNTYLTASYDDAYNWVVDAILYALSHRRWLDEDSNVYGDPDGPDKIINRKLKCIRINHLISSNRFKRKMQINLLSLDSFDDFDNFVGVEDKYLAEDVVRNIIIEYWESCEYLKAIIVDLIASGDCSIKCEEDGKEDFSFEELINCVRTLSDDYIDYFSDTYHLNRYIVNDVVGAITRDKVGQDLWGYGEYEIEKECSEIERLVREEFESLTADDGLRDLLI